MVLGEFEPLVGHEFQADCEPRPAVLTLVEAYPLRDGGGTDRPPFMLIFRSEPNVLLVSGSYAMRSGGFGPDIIDIAQIAAPPKAAAGNYYQAVFN